MSSATEPGDTYNAFERFKHAMLIDGKRNDGKDKWTCPAHDDNDPSLHVKYENGRVLLHCFSGGCKPEDIVAAIGLEMKDLFDKPLAQKPKRENTERPKKSKCVAQYEYVDRNGELLSTKTRWEPGKNGKDKSFTWDNGNPHVLYNLPLVVEAEHVHIGEGEKAADALNPILPSGHVATCPPTSKWEPAFTGCLTAAAVTLWVDRDEHGKKRAAEIYSALTAAGIEVSLVQSAQIAPKADAYDHLDAGFSVEDAVPMNSEELTGAEKDGEEWKHATGTESRTADLIVEQHEGDILYCSAHARWYVFDGTRFARDTKGGDAVLHRAEQTAHRLYTLAVEAEKANNKNAAEHYSTWARKAHSKNHLQGALTLAKTRPEVQVLPEEFDSDPMLFNVENGTIDLRDGTLRPHARADRLTRRAPVKYDAAARCPQFMAYLERVQPDADNRAYLQRHAGTMLIGEAPEEIMFLHHGAGANGKTVFLETMRNVLGGDYSVELPTHALMHNRISRDEKTFVPIEGKRLVTSTELHQGAQMNEPVVKKLTSGEPVQVQPHYTEMYETVPIGTLVITTNYIPKIAGDDDGIWRRLHRIPWQVQIPKEEQDPHLRQKLAAEAPGILNWIIQGCLEFQRIGLHPPDAVKNATEGYRHDEDVLGAFLEDCCCEGAEAWVSTADLKNALEFWHKRNHSWRPPSVRRLTNRLGNQGLQPKKNGGARGWAGLALKGDFRREIDEAEYSTGRRS